MALYIRFEGSIWRGIGAQIQVRAKPRDIGPRDVVIVFTEEIISPREIGPRDVVIVFAEEIISPREIGPRDVAIVFTEEIISRGGVS